MRRLSAACYVVIGSLLTLGVVGCGGTAHAAQKRTAAEVRQAFARHGVKLERATPLIPYGTHARAAAEFMGTDGELSVAVTVYRATSSKRGALLLGSGAPHLVVARNVVAAWTGHDSRRIEAAMTDLR